MPLRIGLIAYPLLLLVLVFGRTRGTVAAFVKARAISPETARKPASIGVKYPEFVERAARKGLLIATGDGRYYANLSRVVKVRRVRVALAGIGGVAILVLAIFAWHPWI